MRAEELGRTLRRMYDSGKKGGEVDTMVHLFGIKYASEILDCDGSPTDIVRLSGIPESLVTEVKKGMKLERYVTPKP